ncbi:MAG: type II toxin-antitoxin system RelE/ParE family toxin [Fibromonadaceae bacterium]|nr:type II toxin-antitoxin system RelE/ParE family toxin [Fibromonadaceae bacterium]
MINSFRDKETKKISDGEISKKFPVAIQKRARRKIDSLALAGDINDLRCPPSNHLEVLSGDRQGQFSIRVNDQYRVCFEWINNCAENVELTDYH